MSTEQKNPETIPQQPSNPSVTSDLQQAAEQVNPEQLSNNINAALDQNNAVDAQPQALSKSEQTPFIDASLRTDK